MPKSISSQKKWEIIFLHLKEQGPRLSISKTSKKLKLSLSTVKHWIKIFSETGDVLEKKSGGRRRKTTHNEDKEIIEMVQNDRELRLKDVSETMKKRGIDVSTETIRRRLLEAKLKFTSPLSKPSISKVQKKNRFKFAKQNRNRNWKYVLFTDETTIKLCSRPKKIWKKRGEKIYIRSQKHYPKIHVWGCFSSFGFGRIVLFQENLTANKLIDIYKRGLLPSIAIFKNHNWTLVEDNDPKHTSKVANLWREKLSIHRLDWPSNSPDLNPIENVWALLKKRVAELEPSNLTQLQKNIKLVWKNLAPNLAQSLTRSMSDRINQVIDREGDSIDY